MIRPFIAMLAATLVAVLILVKTDVVGRLTYSMEKARLRAMRDAYPDVFERLNHSLERARVESARETLPRAGESAARIESGRTLATAVLPAVVSISTERVIARSSLDRLDPHIRRFLMPHRGREEPDPESAAPETEDISTSGVAVAPEEEAEASAEEDEEEPTWEVPSGQGSGFIFDAARGYILTNYHVVEDSDAIHVRLWDGRRYPGRLVGNDQKTDLAVIQIEAEGLHDIPLGDSDSGEVGDEVFAVGNPFGLAGSISRGIISAKNRSNLLLEDVEYQGFLQTDAVINGGNSGGPLVNARGEVIGINCSIVTSTGYFDGIGFAIPSSRAARVIPFLVRGERVTRGYLGVSMRSAAGLDEAARARLGWNEPYGVLVSIVLADSPACAAGLKREDILLTYDGQRLASTAELTQAVADTIPGETATLEVWRDKSLTVIRVEVARQADDFSTRGRGNGQRPCPEKK